MGRGQRRGAEVHDLRTYVEGAEEEGQSPRRPNLGHRPDSRVKGSQRGAQTR